MDLIGAVGLQLLAASYWLADIGFAVIGCCKLAVLSRPSFSHYGAT